MPICKEFRVFVDGGEVQCYHPYWPEGSLIQGGDTYFSPGFDYKAFSTPNDEKALRKLASESGRAVGGKWSVDLLETTKGWYITDMVEAHRSYHWPECPFAE